MPHIIEIAFAGNRKEFFLWDAAEPPVTRAAVIVEADRGEDLGRVHATGELAGKRNVGCSHGCGSVQPTRRALRLATPAEVRQSEELRELNREARRHAMQLARKRSLDMKISDAEWQWDRRKLTLYFTAEHRVDFRQLVRDLAAHFRARIELKQIGVRDEAKRLDGIGRCGRQYCSSSWLPELRPVNLGVAKDQRLSLNPAQISGACGRLMCCLRYEHETYVAARKRFPKEGRTFLTAAGEEKVAAVDIFSERITLRSTEGETRNVSLARFREEVGMPAEAVTRVDSPGSSIAGDASGELAAVGETRATDGALSPPAGQPAATAEQDSPQAGERPRTRRRRGRRGGRGGRRNHERGNEAQGGGSGAQNGGNPAPPDESR